jgi:hypothetical protein
MVVGQTMGDQALFSVAAGIEQALIAGQRNGGAR